MATLTTENPILTAFTLDFETGGTNYQESALVQISLHAVRLGTFERVGTFTRYFYPYFKKEIDGATKKRKKLKSKYDEPSQELLEYSKGAEAVHGISLDTLYDKGEPLEVIAKDMIAFMKDNTPKVGKAMKPFIIGQNPTFDIGFLMQMFLYADMMKELKECLRGKEDFFGNWQPEYLDTIMLGQLALCHLPGMNSYKLGVICERLGIDLDDAHDADADVTATTNIVVLLTQRMRSVGGEIEGGPLEMAKTEKTRKHFKI